MFPVPWLPLVAPPEGVDLAIATTACSSPRLASLTTPASPPGSPSVTRAGL